MSNLLARISTAAFVTGSAITTSFFSGNPERSKRTEVYKEQQKLLDKNLVTPANLTFAFIWPVIYSGTTALAIHQGLPSQANNPRYRKARPWLWACYTLNLVFAYYFSKNGKGARIGGAVTTIATLPAALGLHQALEIGRTEPSEPERTFRKAVSLYAGWLTVATVVSGANLLLDGGYQPAEKAARRWATLALPATTGLGLSVARRLHDPYYPVGIGVGLVGIAVKQASRRKNLAVLATACAVGITGWAVRKILK